MCKQEGQALQPLPTQGVACTHLVTQAWLSNSKADFERWYWPVCPLQSPYARGASEVRNATRS